MFFPLIPALSSICSALGLFGLWWYHGLTKAEREEADRLAYQYAEQLYGKALDKLTYSQLGRICELVKAHLKA